MPLNYSICITCYNEGPTIRRSLDSLLENLNTNFEVVVVDAKSTDATFEILQEYTKDAKIKLFQRRCSRGQGRQLAFENSSGEYIIANLDMDDIFKPTLSKLLNFYHNQCEGKILLSIKDFKVWTQNITIGPRKLFLDLGGWRNLQWSEDWDLWCRAASIGKYAWTRFGIVDETNPHAERRMLIRKFKTRYTIYRDLLRLGRRVFSDGEHISIYQRAAYLFARFTLPFYDSYKSEFAKTFDPYSSRFFIDIRAT